MLQRPNSELPGRWSLLAAAVLAGAVLSGCVPEAPGGSQDPVGPADSGPEKRYSIQLRWNPPEVDAEGARLEDLAGFRLYYAPYPQPVLQGGTVIDIGLDAEARVTDLSVGTWAFGVTALDTAGNESSPSELIQVEVGP